MLPDVFKSVTGCFTAAQPPRLHPVRQAHADTQGLLAVVVIDERLAVTIKVLDIAPESAMEWKALAHLHRATVVG